MRALIYEQSDRLIEFYTKWLTQRRFEVFTTKSLDEAWVYFQTHDVDVVVAKFEAVEVNEASSGVELIQNIRSGKNNSDVFIIVSANDLFRADEIRLIEMKVFAMIRQPATNAAFDSKIDEFFALRNPR